MCCRYHLEVLSIQNFRASLNCGCTRNEVRCWMLKRLGNFHIQLRSFVVQIILILVWFLFHVMVTYLISARVNNLKQMWVYRSYRVECMLNALLKTSAFSDKLHCLVTLFYLCIILRHFKNVTSICFQNWMNGLLLLQ